MADIRFDTAAQDRAYTDQPHLTGTFERSMDWCFGPEAALLDSHGDLLRVDSRTQRIAVCSGDLALICTRVDYSRMSEPHGPEGQVLRLGRVGVEVTKGRAITDSSDGIDWVADSPVIAKFMGSAGISHFDRSLDHKKRIGLIGPKFHEGFMMAEDEVEPGHGYSDIKDEDDFIHSNADKIFTDLANLMSREVSMRLRYAANNDIVVENTSGVSVPSDIRVIAIATNS